MVLELVSGWQVIFVEDFVFAVRHGRNGENQPALVRKVLADQVYARGDLQLLQIADQLLNKHEFAWRFDAYAEYNLILV
jgi:hypothetical protein